MNIEFKATSWKESDIDPIYRPGVNLSGWTITEVPDGEDEEQAGICLVFNPKDGSDRTYEIVVFNRELVKAFGLGN